MYVKDVPVASSLVASGSVAAPGAGSAFVTLNAPPAGVYRIRILYIITGAQETAALNVQFEANGANLFTFPTSQPLAAGTIVSVEIERIDLNGTNNVRLEAAAAATASTVYTGVICATRYE